MAGAWYPYRLDPTCAAMRAMRRGLTGRTDVEKTRHVGAHGGKAPPTSAVRQVAAAKKVWGTRQGDINLQVYRVG